MNKIEQQNTDKYYRLEYSESQGLFHFETQQKDVTGWVIICNKISAGQAMEFCDKMEEKYHTLKDIESRYYPSAKTIKDEFKEFLLSDALP